MTRKEDDSLNEYNVLDQYESSEAEIDKLHSSCCPFEPQGLDYASVSVDIFSGMLVLTITWSSSGMMVTTIMIKVLVQASPCIMEEGYGQPQGQ